MTAGPAECPHVRLLLGAYVLDALSEREAHEVSLHLLLCGACAAAETELARAPGFLALLTEQDLLE